LWLDQRNHFSCGGIDGSEPMFGYTFVLLHLNIISLVAGYTDFQILRKYIKYVYSTMQIGHHIFKNRLWGWRIYLRKFLLCTFFKISDGFLREMRFLDCKKPDGHNKRRNFFLELGLYKSVGIRVYSKNVNLSFSKRYVCFTWKQC
jgi:hypothetical protein